MHRLASKRWLLVDTVQQCTDRRGPASGGDFSRLPEEVKDVLGVFPIMQVFVGAAWTGHARCVTPSPDKGDVHQGIRWERTLGST